MLLTNKYDYKVTNVVTNTDKRNNTLSAVTGRENRLLSMKAVFPSFI